MLLGLSDQGMISRARLVASVEAKRNYRLLVAKFEGELYLLDLGVDVRMLNRRHVYPTVHTLVRSLTICNLHQILLGDKINEVGREFGTRVGEDKFLLGLVEKPEGKRILEIPSSRWKASVNRDLEEMT
jgi:uncharacterized protein involved in type VI secretion and phage assembly